MTPAPHVMISAGEASGDLHAAQVVRALGRRLPGLRCSGLGGPAMAGAGVELVHRMEDLAVMGFSEVLSKLGVIRSRLKSLKRHMAEQRPDLLILVDFPDFNLRLARAANRLGIPVLYFIGPQVWAWRAKRARKVQALVDRLAVVFAFEVDAWYHLAPDLKVRFVGHPVVDELPERYDQGQPLPIPEAAEVVGILPGSRGGEIRRMLPMLLQAASLIHGRRPGLHFVLPVAPGLDRGELEPYLEHAPPGLTIVKGQAGRVMRRARLLLAASGTVTLEAALVGTPMVVVYRTGWFNYLVAKSLVKLDYISLPNLVAGRQVVPELIQGRATPQAVAAEGMALLENEENYQRAVDDLAEVRRLVGGPGAGDRVAEMAQELMGEA